MKIPLVGAVLFLRKDGNNEANSRPSRFCKRAYQRKNLYIAWNQSNDQAEN
jgi:hypothetical protein